MVSLTNIELGSIVYNLIDNIPTGISGTLPYLVEQEVHNAENIIGDTIGITAIGDTYQPAIISLTMGNVLGMMEAQGMGTKSVSIGELSIAKGIVEGTSKTFTSDGHSKLRALGEQTKFFQTYN